MPRQFMSPEAQVFWRYIAGSIDRLVELVEQCPIDVVRWSPPAPGANPIAVLARHTLSNAEENVLGVLTGRAVQRDRETEFGAAVLDRDPIVLAWRELHPRLEAALAALEARDLEAAVAHPRRGPITGREVLIVVARHAAEHLGQAELTRDLAVAALARR
ncbi:MAG TPA: DinB family protein [Tepidiformaceae bacterium]|nr:DinB family protein [Tepidiformaceae bacterium]